MNKFYNDFFKYNADEANLFKMNFIKSNIQEGYIYKFISFSEDMILNEVKLNCLARETIWFSHHGHYEDPSELKVPLNYFKASRLTGRDIRSLKYSFASIRELNDICCFTSRIDDFMWINYANNYSGICLCFEIVDYNNFFPIEYIKKDKFDLTDSVIKSIKDMDNGNYNSLAVRRTSILPLVIKDLKYKQENEIRLLHCPFDDGSEPFNGYVRPNIKADLNYKGTERSYSKSGIELKSVIYGERLEENIKNRIKLILE